MKESLRPNGRTRTGGQGAGRTRVGRREFLQSLTATLAAVGGAAAGSTAPFAATAQGATVSPLDRTERAKKAYRLRVRAAALQRHESRAVHPTNGDEERYASRAGNFSKGLPHNARGEVDPAAYDVLLRALRTGQPQDFEAIPMGAAGRAAWRRLVNPQAGFAFDLEGVDSHATTMLAAPALASAHAAGEIVENYWMALARDVPFIHYGSDPITRAAAADLTQLSDFYGPKLLGEVTTQTLFRDALPRTLTGPYLSQFLWLPVPFGANYVEQRMRTARDSLDYGTTFAEWLAIQQGHVPARPVEYDSQRRFIRNGRDLSQWVHIDVLYQAYFHAMLILLSAPDLDDEQSNGMGAPVDPANPYAASQTQDAFATFGPPHVASLMCEVASRALKAAWFQKWAVHRRLRPEAYAERVHAELTGLNSYPVALDELSKSDAPEEIFRRHGSYLLPLAFPEGSPLHPSYAAGHATVAGACVTVLKAWFDEAYVIPNPVTASPDGLTLLPYTGSDLTIGGELNKLASNIATGRNIAGVHWRSDASESLKLGEAVAISILRDQHETYHESFDGFTLTKFDGTTVRI